MHFIVGSHWTMSLICFRSLVWSGVLFLDLDVLYFLIFSSIFPIILRMKSSGILQGRPVSILIYFVIVLPSLRCLVALLVGTVFSSRWIVDAVFVLFVLVVVGDGTFFVLVGIANVWTLVWRLIVVNLDDSSLVWCWLLAYYFNLAVDAAWSSALLFFVFVNQALNVIILG